MSDRGKERQPITPADIRTVLAIGANRKALLERLRAAILTGDARRNTSSRASWPDCPRRTPMMTPGDSRPEVISLIRFSTAEQVSEGKAGIDRQRRANEAGAMLHGLRIRREMLCIDVSGRHVKDDPQFQALFEEMKDPTLTGVIAPEQSRIFRPEEYADYAILDHFGRNKKLIFTPSARIDPTTSEGRMTLVMGGLMSGEELHKIRDRCNGGKMTKRLEGKHPGGNQLLPKTVKFVRVRNAEGIKTGETYWELVPIEVARMKLAFQLLFEGDSYELIAEKIGGGWTGSGLHRAMMNPIHIGIRRYQWEAKGDEYMPKASAKNPKPKKRRRLVKRAAPLDIPTREDLESGKAKPIVEPILTLAEWDRAQEIIVSRMTRWRKSKLKNDGRARHLATGIACCSCSDPLYPRYGSRTPDNLVDLCKSRFRGGKGCGAQLIRRDEMDAAIEQTLSTPAYARLPAMRAPVRPRSPERRSRSGAHPARADAGQAGSRAQGNACHGARRRYDAR